ncbi:MAG: hypothetical protein PHY72_02185 [Candidatus Pacebacteria bacterium]|nr:hypothetical protein [Candidatus Paceibacterota bacterium]
MPIDIGNGGSIVPNFIFVPPGNGVLANVIIPPNSTQPTITTKTNGVRISSGPQEAEPVTVISVGFKKPIYYEGFDVTTHGGIIRNYTIDDSLPGHLRVQKRSQSSGSISFLATGWGEETNHQLVSIWVQQTQGETVGFDVSPKWAVVNQDVLLARKIPVDVSTSQPLAEISFEISNVKPLWVDAGPFFPQIYMDDLGEDGSLTVYNTEFSFVGQNGAAPPSRQAISAMLADRGYELKDNSVLRNGQVIWNLNPPRESGKKPTSWGAIKE